ncbi:hypothetical protein [Streptomyces sp. NPDC020983]|uniref:hypothetical protein n=1 Tax=Streptomyces sp. NPDC020983 TaxID=3365106 RepID=UPI0037903AC2
MSELLWVAVPGGLTTPDQALLRLLVIPRLDPGTKLAAAGLAHWPPPVLTQPGTTLSVDLASAADGPVTTHGAVPGSDVQPGVWEAFFGPDAGVRPARPAPQRQMSVRPTAADTRRVVGTYQASARTLRDADSAPAYQDKVRSELAGYQDDETPAAPQTSAAAADSESPDVHQVLSLLREHPAVMRAMGLILTLPVPVAALPAVDEGVVRVRWDTPAAGLPPIVSPWSAYERTEFLPSGSDAADVAHGMLMLGRPHWDLNTIDAASALARLRDAARTEAAAAADAAAVAAARAAALAAEEVGTEAGEEAPPEETPPAAADTGPRAPALPALRTAGILLVREGREELLTARQQEGDARVGRPGSELPVLTAEHLLLGYRLDARVFGETWHSLCRRLATYSVGGRTLAADLKEEGHIKARSAVDHGDGVLRADEVVAGWTGWSPVVPRPVLNGHATGDADGTGNSLPFDFGWTMKPEPGTLLKLRFGTPYQLRVRTVDIAGGGRAPEDPSPDGCDSEQVLFGRHEPISAPTVTLPDGVAETALGPGATTYVMVVRDQDDAPDGRPADASRSLLPPVASFDIAERHGKFDGAAPGDTFGLVERDRLPDPAAVGVAVFLRPGPGGPAADLEPKKWQDDWPDQPGKHISLEARHPGEPTMNWNTDDELTVALSPAEQVTLDVSSFLDATTLGAFALSGWLPQNTNAGADAEVLDEALAAVVTGRNPMISPAATLTLLHAVKRPLAQPAGTLRADRTEGLTYADLAPDPPSLGVNMPSTATLEVTGSWTEVDDSGSRPVSAPADTVLLGRGDTEIPAIRHEFHDTKHRRVTYTLTANSRFRQYYGAGAPADFQTSATTPEVMVLNSARPVVPQVLSVVPAFTWTSQRDGGSVTHRRLGNRLRFELARPWFTTGAEEALALLVPQGEPADALLPYVTLQGRDPIWDTAEPPVSPVIDAPELTLAEDESLSVLAAACPVWSHGDSWYADIVLPGTASYCPMVRPAVARLQEHSVPGLQLSPVVRTDFVPLLPDRTLTVTPAQDQVQVRLDGIGPSGPEGNQVLVTAERQPAAGAGVDGSAANPADPDAAGWTTVGEANGALGDLVTVDAPAPGPLRVRVREREMVVPGDPRPPLPGAEPEPPSEMSQRVVFTDVVPL